MSNNNQDNNKSQQQSDGGRGGVAFGTAIAYDDAYGADGTANGMVTSLPTVEEERKLLGLDDDDDIDEEEDEGRLSGSHPSTTAAAQQRAKQAEDAHRSSSDDPFAAARASGSGTGLVNTKIADRESSYHARRHDRAVREDGMSYKDAMVMANLERERGELVEEARRELIDEETGEFKERLDANDDGGEGGDGVAVRRRRMQDVEGDGGMPTRRRVVPISLPMERTPQQQQVNHAGMKIPHPPPRHHDVVNDGMKLPLLLPVLRHPMLPPSSTATRQVRNGMKLR
eukprot:g2920.t1 g2920   contig12:1065939-1066793(-)